jgi:dinuclear metal center YbgI/SA1388 family protein
MDDHGPNGLQVEGRDEIRSIAAGVTASKRVIQEAIRLEADALIVHHGIFWEHMGAPRLKGWLGDRVRLLMESRMNLIVQHLPLDLHPELGNNARLLKALGLEVHGRFGERDIGFFGDYERPVPTKQVMQGLEAALQAKVVLIDGGKSEIERVGVVTGAGQRYLEDAIAAECDLFITGEASEFVTHIARETRTHYAWAGHHATERFGVKALCSHLEEKFGVDTSFIDEENPV